MNFYVLRSPRISFQPAVKQRVVFIFGTYTSNLVPQASNLSMILWTIRHSKPYNPKDVCYGRLDFDVSPTFPEESSKAIDAFLKTGAKPTCLYSSPLLRCMRLAEKVSEATGLPIEKKDNIIEISFGSWEGVKLSDVPKEEMMGWQQDLRGFRFPTGENFYDVDARVSEFLDTLPDDGEFLWVTHAGVIASLQHFACGLPDEDFVEGKFSYTMVTRFDLQRNADGHYRGTYTKIHDGIQMNPLPICK